MKFNINIQVEYNSNSDPKEIEQALERELDRHIQDGLLLFDEEIEQYSAEVEYVEVSNDYHQGKGCICPC